MPSDDENELPIPVPQLAPRQSSGFRLEAKYISLTFSDCDRLDQTALFAHLTAGLAKIPDYALLSREIHPTTGAQHFHGLLYYDDGLRTRKQRYFDFDSVHPNVQACRNPKNWFDYCQKDGGDIRTFGTLPPKLSGKSGDWGQCLAKATSVSDFHERVRTSFPRDWILFNDRILAFGAKYFETPDDYETPKLDYVVPESLQQWNREYIQEVSFCVSNSFTRVLIFN